MDSFPRSPFSTPLSGSARETEDRIRNIFQYKKKRPPILLLVLACALSVALLSACGSGQQVAGHPSSGSEASSPEQSLEEVHPGEDPAQTEVSPVQTLLQKAKDSNLETAVE